MRMILFLIVPLVLFQFSLAQTVVDQNSSDQNEKPVIHTVYYEKLDSSLVAELTGILIQGIKYKYREEIDLSLTDNVLANDNIVPKSQAVEELSKLKIDKYDKINTEVKGKDEKTKEWVVFIKKEGKVWLVITIQKNTLISGYTKV